MTFDRSRAEGTLVEVLDGLERDRAVGMGFRLLDGVIATACHCLPRVGGKLALPDPDQPGQELVRVRLRHPGTGQTAIAAVLVANPCCDLALLGAGSFAGPALLDRPGRDGPLADLLASLVRAPLHPAPPGEGRVFIHTHQGRWVEGIASGSSISIWRPSDKIRTGTSGAPVFDEAGRVVGLVGPNDIRLPDVTLCVLADHLPGWALRQVHEAEAAGGEGTAAVR